MGDLPGGPALLALARDVLLNDLLPLLPQESRLSARLVANSMSIAEREAIALEGSPQEIVRELRMFYGGPTLTHQALRARSPLSRTAGDGADPRIAVRGEAGGGEHELLQRFAQDLRAGAFESEARERGARDVLWRLTIAKLRLANPRFLAANGFD
jgi:Domain of unknown function (DUF6285)